MKRNKSRKSALLMSALSLLTCMTMLIGSTFAWFTDSVTSSGNKIVSGTLDVKLYNWENNDWKDISDSTAPLFTENILWEPGYVHAKLLKVENAGNLALTWKAQFNSNVELTALADAIDVYVCPGATSIASDRNLDGYTNVGTLRSFVNTISTTTVGTLKEQNESATLGLALKMREDAGNEYQTLTLGAFDISIYATQLTHESDSFGPDYDAEATKSSSATMEAGKATKLNFETAPSTTTNKTIIEVPADVYTGQEVAMTIETSNSLFDITADGAVVGSLNVEMLVDGVKVSEELEDGKVYTVTTYISKGLNDVSVSYVGSDKDQPTLVSYDSETGKLVFTTNHFSEYAVSGKALAYNAATDTAMSDVVTIVAAQNSGAAVVIPPANSLEFALEVEEAINNGTIQEDSVNMDKVYPVKVSDKYFTTLVAAIEAAGSEDTITMLNDIIIDPAALSNAYGSTGINIKNGQDLDGQGKTLNIKGAGGTWDSGINTTGGVIKNLTVTGSFRGIFINHNSDYSEPVILENVTLDGTVYTISCDQGKNQTLKATGSTFKGWTSYATTLGSAEFEGCYFGEGRGYSFCRPYAPTAFVDCDFEAGYEMDPRATVTFKNCRLDGVTITAENLATLVTSNIANASVVE